jgi:hypothetical protein
MMKKYDRAEIKLQWMAALLGGEYQQTKQRLRAGRGKGFCCLGVACDLYSQLEGEGEWEEVKHPAYENPLREFNLRGKVKEGLPQQEVLEWLGINDSEAWKLAALNDNGKKFKDIAKKISEL